MLRVVPRVDDAVVLPEELVPRIPGDLTELVVGVRDSAVHVGNRHDGRVIERTLEVGELPIVISVHTVSMDILAKWP